MAIVCAKPECISQAIPDPEDGLTRFVTLVCSTGVGNHRDNSVYTHIGCAERLALALVGRVGFIPYCYEVGVSFDPEPKKFSEKRADDYYYCGDPGCLVKILRLYGSATVKQLLEIAEADPERALDSLPNLDMMARIQLSAAINEVGTKALQEREREEVFLPQPPVIQEPVEIGPTQWQPRLEDRAARPLGSKNILLIGAGAVGSFFAHRLLSAGHEVVVVERQPQVDALRQVGFRILEKRLVSSSRPTALVPSLAEAFPPRVEYDLLILATKAYDAPQILRELPAARFPLPRKVMIVQNGVEIEERAGRLLGANRVLAASLSVPVSITSPGSIVIEHGNRGLGLASLSRNEPVDEWVNLFEAAGIATKAYDDYKSMKWSKLFLNIVANATCAILNRKPAVIYHYRPTFNLEYAMLKEALAVMDKMGIQIVDLPGSPARMLAHVIKYVPVSFVQMILEPQIRRGRGDKMPSLYLDLAAGRKESEVTFLNGAVVRYGRPLGIATPINFVLTDTLHRLVKGILLWEDFRGKPEALMARVRAIRETD